MTPEQTKQIYILVLYERVGNEPPKFKGLKKLTLEEYNLLVKDYKSSIEVMGKRWGILERRWYNHDMPDIQNIHYVVIDAQKI